MEDISMENNNEVGDTITENNNVGDTITESNEVRDTITVSRPNEVGDTVLENTDGNIGDSTAGNDTNLIDNHKSNLEVAVNKEIYEIEIDNNAGTEENIKNKMVAMEEHNSDSPGEMINLPDTFFDDLMDVEFLGSFDVVDSWKQDEENGDEKSEEKDKERSSRYDDKGRRIRDNDRSKSSRTSRYDNRRTYDSHRYKDRRDGKNHYSSRSRNERSRSRSKKDNTSTSRVQRDKHTSRTRKDRSTSRSRRRSASRHKNDRSTSRSRRGRSNSKSRRGRSNSKSRRGRSTSRSRKDSSVRVRKEDGDNSRMNTTEIEGKTELLNMHSNKFDLVNDVKDQNQKYSIPENNPLVKETSTEPAPPGLEDIVPPGEEPIMIRPTLETSEKDTNADHQKTSEKIEPKENHSSDKNLSVEKQKEQPEVQNESGVAEKGREQKQSENFKRWTGGDNVRVVMPTDSLHNEAPRIWERAQGIPKEHFSSSRKTSPLVVDRRYTRDLWERDLWDNERFSRSSEIPPDSDPSIERDIRHFKRLRSLEKRDRLQRMELDAERDSRMRSIGERDDYHSYREWHRSRSPSMLSFSPVSLSPIRDRYSRSPSHSNSRARLRYSRSPSRSNSRARVRYSRSPSRSNSYVRLRYSRSLSRSNSRSRNRSRRHRRSYSRSNDSIKSMSFSLSSDDSRYKRRYSRSSRKRSSKYNPFYEEIARKLGIQTDTPEHLPYPQQHEMAGREQQSNIPYTGGPPQHLMTNYSVPPGPMTVPPPGPMVGPPPGPVGGVPPGPVGGVPPGPVGGVPPGPVGGVPPGSVGGVPPGCVGGVPPGHLGGVPPGSVVGVPPGPVVGAAPRPMMGQPAPRPMMSQPAPRPVMSQPAPRPMMSQPPPGMGGPPPGPVFRAPLGPMANTPTNIHVPPPNLQVPPPAHHMLQSDPSPMKVGPPASLSAPPPISYSQPQFMGVPAPVPAPDVDQMSQSVITIKPQPHGVAPPESIFKAQSKPADPSSLSSYLEATMKGEAEDLQQPRDKKVKKVAEDNKLLSCVKPEVVKRCEEAVAAVRAENALSMVPLGRVIVQPKVPGSSAPYSLDEVSCFRSPLYDISNVIFSFTTPPLHDFVSTNLKTAARKLRQSEQSKKLASRGDSRNPAHRLGVDMRRSTRFVSIGVNTEITCINDEWCCKCQAYNLSDTPFHPYLAPSKQSKGEYSKQLSASHTPSEYSKEGYDSQRAALKRKLPQHQPGSSGPRNSRAENSDDSDVQIISDEVPQSSTQPNPPKGILKHDTKPPEKTNFLPAPVATPRAIPIQSSENPMHVVQRKLPIHNFSSFPHMRSIYPNMTVEQFEKFCAGFKESQHKFRESFLAKKK